MTKVKLVPVEKNLENCQKIADFHREHYDRVPYMPTAQDIKNGSSNYFWAYSGDDLIGMTGYYLKTKTLAETVKTIIFKDYRGKGFGKLVSEAIEAEVKSRGVKKIMSTIYSFNIPMISIKLKQGYMIEGYHPDHEAPGFDEYSLGKILK
ncbi:MAG: GNAT family N-acetyltransferase [Bacteriovoracaceae bacterium]|nr:GNAT family N-acetyltransferase [Bacteriovoracaceae bacterium]